MSLSTSDAGCGAIRVMFEGTSLRLEYEGHRPDGNPILGHLRFDGVIAFRFRDEPRSAGFIEGSYDTVLELSESPWLQELSDAEPPGFGDVARRHHFAVLLSQNGYLEVIAEAVDEKRAPV